MLPVSAPVRDENMAEFTERLTLEDFRGQNCAFVCDWLQKRGLQKALLRIYYEVLIDLEVRKE